MSKYINYRVACFVEVGKVCYLCDSEEDIEVHHINGRRQDNKPENLIPLCESCHFDLHQTSRCDGPKWVALRELVSPNAIDWGRNAELVEVDGDVFNQYVDRYGSRKAPAMMRSVIKQEAPEVSADA